MRAGEAVYFIPLADLIAQLAKAARRHAQNKNPLPRPRIAARRR
ncbi:MAG: hypothetical protein Q8R44_01740 [Novosphingobium sp.]|nr:hypothetical protein [Novosphingobium sp.]